jgi:hypothetical protein
MCVCVYLLLRASAGQPPSKLSSQPLPTPPFPLKVGADALKGTGQLPKFHEDLFRLAEPLNGREAYLIPTAEVRTLSLFLISVIEGSVSLFFE